MATEALGATWGALGLYEIKDKRIIVYPAYINSKFTVKEGRRIPAPLACENPSAHEVMESVMRLGFKCDLEVSLITKQHNFTCSHWADLQNTTPLSNTVSNLRNGVLP